MTRLNPARALAGALLATLLLAACDPGKEEFNNIYIVEQNGQLRDALTRYEALAAQYPNEDSGQRAKARVADIALQLADGAMKTGKTNEAGGLYEKAALAADPARAAEIRGRRDKLQKEIEARQGDAKLKALTGARVSTFSDGETTLTFYPAITAEKMDEAIWQGYGWLLGRQQVAKSAFAVYPKLQKVVMKPIFPNAADLNDVKNVRFTMTLERGQLAADLDWGLLKYTYRDTDYYINNGSFPDRDPKNNPEAKKFFDELARAKLQVER